MRNYEIVLIIHPDYGDQISHVIKRYTDMIIDSKGKVHRVENWGRRQLSYSIKKLNKAYYILLNIEVFQDTLNELNNNFKFNEIILRNIVIRTKYAITEDSPMIKKKEDNQESHVSEVYQKH